MRLGPRIMLGALSDDSVFELLAHAADEQHRAWRQEAIRERVPWDALENECILELRRRRLPRDVES